MKLPNWFKITWWIIVTSACGLLFRMRISAILESKSTPIDMLILAIFVALILAPLFQEVELLGVKLKQAVDDLQKQISAQFTTLRTDIQSSISNTSNINLSVPAQPVADEQLPDLEQRIRSALMDVLQSHGGLNLQPTTSSYPEITDDVLYLFQSRYAIEKQLRSIIAPLYDFPNNRHPSITDMSRALVKSGVLHPNIASAIREIYSVCSPAIHGHDVSQAQVKFVRDLFPTVMQALAESDSLCLFKTSDQTANA